MQGRKALIEKFLKCREILKKCIIDVKIGKQRFQEDVAQLLRQPIKAELDKQQDKLIERLQAGQYALPLTQADIVNAIKAISGAPRLPAIAEAVALPTPEVVASKVSPTLKSASLPTLEAVASMVLPAPEAAVLAMLLTDPAEAKSIVDPYVASDIVEKFDLPHPSKLNA